MATEFTNTATDEVAFKRFAGGRDRGVCFEFGSVTNFEETLRWVDAGAEFEPEPGQGWQMNTPADFTRAGLERLVREGRVTFGEMPFTVALGSGDTFRLFDER